MKLTGQMHWLLTVTRGFIQLRYGNLTICQSGQCTLPGMMHQVLGAQTPGLWMGGWGLLGGPAADSVSDMAWNRCRSKVASGFSVLSLIYVAHMGGLQ